MKIERTGNPFVDMSLCSLTALAEKDCINKLTLNDFNEILKKHDWAEINKSLKCFTMVFGNNGPLFQSAYKGKNLELYRELLTSLYNSVLDMEGRHGQTCEICGKGFDFDINIIWEKALNKFELKSKDKKYMGRDFFPLLGSIGNDAQILPSASRTLNVCPFCLFVVNFLPVGTMLLRGRLVCLESNSERLMVDMVKDIVKENIGIYMGGRREIIGAKQGAKAFIEKLLKMFRGLIRDKKRYQLPEHSCLYVWQFSNSGTGADCDLIEIPNKSLSIIKEMSEHGGDFLDEVYNLIRKDKKDRFLESLQDGKDLKELYPYKKDKGVSPRLFSYYQQRVCGISPESLKSAYIIAQRIIMNCSPKEKPLWQKSDVFYDSKGNTRKNQARKVIVDLIEEGLMSYENYTELFPASLNRPLTVESKGWDLIMYYLYNFEGVKEIVTETGYQPILHSQKTDLRIKEFAEMYFRYYVLDKKKGHEKFKKEIIDKMKETNIWWLKDNYAKMAEVYEGKLLKLEYDEWTEWCHDENGNIRVSELMFQLRLAFANLYRDYINKMKGE